MKKSVIITVLSFVLGVIILTGGFILLTDNNISKNLFPTTTTTTPTTTTKPSGEENPTYEPMNFFNEDVSKYITLGEYKNLEIPVDQLEASDEEIKFQIDLILLTQAKEFTKVYEGTIEEKVYFTFNYTGYYANEDGTKGEKFDGGEGKDQLAYIDGDTLVTISSSGSLGNFIDGFAQGMRGANVGETLDIPMTFPSDYHNADMANKKVIFEVKINYVAQLNFTDGWVNSYTEGKYKTTAEYEKFIAEDINAQLEEYNNQVIWTTITNNAKVIEIPQQQFDYQYNSFIEEIEYYRSMYAMYGQSYTFEQMLNMYGFNNLDELKQYTNDYIKADLVCYAIMQTEGIEASDEEYRILLDELIEASEMTEEQILEKYGEEYIKQRIMFDELSKLVLTSNKLVLKTTDNQ